MPPSIKFISAAVAVTPSRILSSAAVLVIAVALIANLPVGTFKVPLSSIVATVVPSYCLKLISLASTCGWNTTSEELLVIFKILYL